MENSIQTGGRAGAEYGKTWHGTLDDMAKTEVKTAIAPSAASEAGLSGNDAERFAKGFVHGWRAALRDRGSRRGRVSF